MTAAERNPSLVVVAGFAADGAAQVADQLCGPTTAVIHHDLRLITQGVVRRRLRAFGADVTTAVELAHGCVSCTLREDLLPLVRRLIDGGGLSRIVLHLDPALEPEAVCWALHHVLVDDRPILADVEVAGVLTVLDERSWLDDAGGDEPIAERGMAASVDDERTVAQVLVGQVEFADALVRAHQAEEPWAAARTAAVLDRLAPTAPRAALSGLDVESLLARVPSGARRGMVDDAHGPLLRGQPPLDSDCGVATVLFQDRRPFHPDRLHEAIDVLLDGVIRTRGRLWLATRPGEMLWLESAGGGLRVAPAGPWLAAVDAEAWAAASAERQAAAALRWDAVYGDRVQEFVVITHRADPEEICAALRNALLTDVELAEGAEAWQRYEDPFGAWHSDPCEDDDTGRDGIDVVAVERKDER
ncbi:MULTISPECIES: ribosome hibernation factor-recruiting GTPase MRF [Actinoalloteichus]|uniref:GTPase, G3E family n=1 Tax=Actinoalloteichus fjordicus TaxID=1612552 RepID=A0AAC9LG47_9PSEU|nr:MULTISPECIES: GTP-binding protein [Actinoalloteichus]APU16254.1 putative GTPase, G3E family [Actinoalloteichus fjordicus]APU22314.1 putative GTPase, G3E family [Actinoalloteichus sp. GBA129-24]